MIQYILDNININHLVVGTPRINQRLGRYNDITANSGYIDLYNDDFMFSVENSESLLYKNKDDLSKIQLKIYNDETDLVLWDGIIDNIERVDSKIIRLNTTEIFIKVLGQEYCEYNANDLWVGSGAYANPGVPNVPINLTAEALTGTTMLVSWSSNSDDLHKETGFYLYYSIDDMATWEASINITNPYTMYYNFSSLTPSKAYYFKVVGYNLLGDSAETTPISGTTFALATFRKNPYLQFVFEALVAPSTIYQVDNTKMKVTFQSVTPADAISIDWGTTISYGTTSGSISALAHTTLDGDTRMYSYDLHTLIPNTLYYYRVNLDSETYENSFYAPSVDNYDTLVVYAISDIQATTEPGLSAKDDLAALILADMPTAGNKFLYLGGDMVYEGSEEQWQDDFFDPAKTNWVNLLAKIPTHAIRGGHENLPPISVGDDPTTFRKYFFPVLGRDRYNFEMGPALFSLLCNIDDTDPNNFLWAGTSQYNDTQWALENTLKELKAMFWHVPAYGAGGEHANDVGFQAVHDDLFAPNGVDIVLNGHNHYFAHTYNTGVNDFTIGGGGGPNYEYTPYPDPAYPGVVYAESGYGLTPPLFFYIKMVFEDFGSYQQITFTAVKDDGTTLYSYVI